MGMLDDYKISCDYIRKEFKLPEDTNLYELVNKVTIAYKAMVEEKELDKLKEEEKSTIVETSNKGKKRGRPRKSK